MIQTVPQSTKNRIKEEVQRCTEIASRVFGVFLEPSIVYEIEDVQQTIAGMAIYASNTVYYNPWFATTQTEAFLARTVPHEVAHLVVRVMQLNDKASWRIDPHGPLFRKVMKAFGVNKENQSEKHDYDCLVLPNYKDRKLVACVCCKHKHGLVPHQARLLEQDAKRYGCVKCGGDLKWI